MLFAAEIQELEELRTANTRAWVPIVEQEDGTLGPDPGAGYTELAGGLHWNAAQAGDEPIWLSTRLDWEADPKGGAIILEAPRTARLAPKLTDMPMLAIHPQDANTPPLAFAFHGLGYWNRATGAFAWIGHAQPAKLQLAGNIAYYADALQGLSATWIVEHKLTGVGAGLLLHQAPLPPTAYGFAAGDPVDLVVVSEMIDLNADLRLTL
ncbi:MAG: hypothetical protein PHC78_12685, partial [Verrucomicrobiota bacterium]|nr:hypothetical protein [Verrucomicrobiota bacterium]